MAKLCGAPVVAQCSFSSVKVSTKGANQSWRSSLVALDGDDLLWERELAVFWRKTGSLSPVARDFLDAVVQWR